jgi:hypothetical protein
MRTVAAFAVIAATFSVTHEVNAQGTYYPWCARYNAYTYNCGFKTWQQCQATVSGAGGICQENRRPWSSHARAASANTSARTRCELSIGCPSGPDRGS